MAGYRELFICQWAVVDVMAFPMLEKPYVVFAEEFKQFAEFHRSCTSLLEYIVTRINTYVKNFLKSNTEKIRPAITMICT